MLSPQALSNIAYRSQLAADGVAPLANGLYTETVGGAGEIRVRLASPLAYGTLFGLDAAAVILAEGIGGSETFASLALVVDANGLPVNIAAVPLPDGAQVNGLEIADDAITVSMITGGPGDPRCCPSHPTEQTYELGLNAVTPGGLPLPVDIGGGTGASEPDETPPLAGTNWVWVNTRMGDGSVIAPEDPAAFTLTFNDDGSFGSTTDCNSVGGQFSADDATGQLSFGQMAATLMACEEETLESTYTGQLAGAASYLVRDGSLFVALKFASGIMEFVPAE
jgi:heat shock protein HslJ